MIPRISRETTAALAQLREDTRALADEALALADLTRTLCERAEDRQERPLRRRGDPCHLRIVKGLIFGAGAAMAAARKFAVGAGATALTASVVTIAAVPLVTAAAPPGSASVRPPVHKHMARRRPRAEDVDVPYRGGARQHHPRHRQRPVINMPPPVITSPSPSPSPSASVSVSPSPTPLVSVSVGVGTGGPGSSPSPSPSPSSGACVTGVVCLGL